MVPALFKGSFRIFAKRINTNAGGSPLIRRPPPARFSLAGPGWYPDFKRAGSPKPEDAAITGRMLMKGLYLWF